MLFRITLIIFSILCLRIELEAADKKATVCLNMIVKDEKDVICRCLESVKPIIDTWVIVDTGSTDGTQKIIKDYMKDVPGELHERPWVDFAHNRNEALILAKNKADYILFMDADDTLIIAKDFKIPTLDKDAYYVEIEDGGSKYSRRQLIQASLNWEWIGVLHEAITCSEVKNEGTLQGVIYKRNYDGARSKDSNKFQKDALVLEEALKKDPTNSRYMFYLAQSYRDAKDYESSIKSYEKRIAMGGWDQEVYWSMLQVGLMKSRMDKEEVNRVIDSFYRAYLYRPSRAESPYYLAAYYRSLNCFHAAYALLQEGLKIPLPTDILFVEKWIYDYGLMLEYSICAYWVGKYPEAKKASNYLLGKPGLPQSVRDVVEGNQKWIDAKIAGIESISALKKA